MPTWFGLEAHGANVTRWPYRDHTPGPNIRPSFNRLRVVVSIRGGTSKAAAAWWKFFSASSSRQTMRTGRLSVR